MKLHLTIFIAVTGFIPVGPVACWAQDCNGNGIPDDQEIADGISTDCNGNGVPDECDIASGGFPPVINLADLNGTNGFIINGIDVDDFSGRSVSGAGDVNGDGIDDLIIAAPTANRGVLHEVSESYVVFGNAAGFAASLNLADLDGANGLLFEGIDARDHSGASVSGAGDVNGDGIDDLIIGASSADPFGRNDAGGSYVVFGTADGFAASLFLAALNGDNGFFMFGISERDFFGVSVSAAGDVNADGIDDLIIGAPGADPFGRSDAGESYVVLGTAAGFAASLNLAGLNGANGFVVNGIDSGDFSGFSATGAGDVNGDGIDDLVIGADTADPNGQPDAGESYVVFGNAAGFPAGLNLADLDGSNGFVINGIDEGDRSGRSVSGAGDVNADGVDDLIIGAPFANPEGKSDAGESYVLFGSGTGFPATMDLADLDGSNGFVINGITTGDRAGWSVSGVGDVNEDGIDDLIIGAYVADPNGQSDAGESYVIFGTAAGFKASFNLGDLDGTNGFVINGIDSEDFSGFSVSGAGDVNGDGIDDLIIGASGADSNGRNQAGESYVVFGRPFSTDCNDNGILDACEDDCNENNILDGCDIANGISEDCIGNGIPDECEVDCDDNGSPDECDIADETSEDCNGTDIPDECEIANGSSRDCNTNGIPDNCEATLADAVVSPPEESHALNTKNRYLSFVATNPGMETSLSVTLIESEQFPEAVGATWWVGPPAETCENGAELLPPCSPVPGVPSSTFLSPSLQCEKHCTDWGSLGEVIHVGDINVVPGATYEIRAIPCGCHVADPSNFSDPLVVSTSAWGDTIFTCGECPCAPAEGIVNIVDCTAVVQRFANSSCAPLKSRVDLEPAVPDGLINITDVLACIKGFLGLEYDLSVPVGCN